MKLHRIVIYPAEASQLLGKSLSSVRTLFQNIRDAHEKASHQMISIREFCDYLDLPYDDVFSQLNHPSKNQSSSSRKTAS